MTDPFGRGYAGAYDALYADKDYAAEVDAFEARALQREVGCGTVLDLGCGTGGHALELARRGWDVTAVDRSAAMLELARTKAAAAGLDINLSTGDVRRLDLGRSFDLVLMTFALLGYQVENADVSATMAVVAAHLRPGGIVLFDVWYGPAVLTIGPTDRMRVVELPGGRLYRFASSTLDVAAQCVDVRYELVHVRSNGPADVGSEDHRVRFFFPLELKLFAETAGLELLSIEDVDDPGAEPTTQTWNVLVALRKPSL